MRLLASLAVLALLAPPARANDGPVVLLQGGSIQPVDEQEVALVGEKVRIRTFGPPAWGVLYMSRVRVDYVLENLSDGPRVVTTGFPLANCPVPSRQDVEGFMKLEIRDGGEKLPLDEVRAGDEGDETCWAISTLAFGPREVKKLRFTYRQQWRAVPGGEQLVYMLSPASHWAGDVGSMDIAFEIGTTRSGPDPVHVRPCNLSFSIGPDRVGVSGDRISVGWHLEHVEPADELFVAYDGTSCSSDAVVVENAVSSYLNGAELQCEGEGQERNIAAALADVLSLSVSELEKKRYEDYLGNPGRWDLALLVFAHFVPDSPHKKLAGDFWGDLKSPRVQELVKQILSTLSCSL
jgi:hypothetical protein